MTVQSYSYDKEDIIPGIVHIGVGNFHRAHQQYYTHQLLEQSMDRDWGICGVCLLPADEMTVRHLRNQHLDYTLTVCGRNGTDRTYLIGSLTELIWSIENPQAVIDKIAGREIRIISLTITEGGYNLNKETREFDLANPGIQHDLQNPQNPATVFGFVAEGLRQRKRKGNGGITILSCDNLQHNGNTARDAFTAFIRAQDPDLAVWVNSHVTFPNSMVDRITPVTTPEDVIRLNGKSGAHDQSPVYCEDFTQWVIEDDFMAGRPAWENAGVEFTRDVTAFENMKLSLLNASHLLLAYPSFLKGYRRVDEAMRDPGIVQLIKDFMDLDITPYVPAPEHTDLEQYKKTLIERFSNQSVSDQVSRLCFDGISKFPVYIMPNLVKMMRDGKDLMRPAFLFASYRHYLKYGKDDHGHPFEIAEPWLTPEDSILISSENPVDFLHLTAFRSTDLKADEKLVALFKRFSDEIRERGLAQTLESIV